MKNQRQSCKKLNKFARMRILRAWQKMADNVGLRANHLRATKQKTGVFGTPKINRLCCCDEWLVSALKVNHQSFQNYIKYDNKKSTII